MTYPERGYLGDSGSHTWVCSSRDPGRRAAVGIVEEQWGMLDICRIQVGIKLAFKVFSCVNRKHVQ